MYGGKEYKAGETVYVSQFFTVADVVAINVEGHTAKVSMDAQSKTIYVEYNKIQEYRQISSLSELKNDAAYHIKAKSGEGYLAWNTTVTDTYLSLRGVTTYSHNNLPSNQAVAQIYQSPVDPFDMTVVWQIINEDGKYYLFQPAKQEYVTRDGRDYKFTAEKTALDNIRDNGNGTFSFHAGGSYSENSTYFACIVTGEALTPVRNWTWDDHGSVMYIVENPNITLGTTGVEGVVVEKDDAPKAIYNLQGQKLDRLPESGIVIVDGHKYLIK